MKKEKFIAWLRANGAEVLPTTNSYEIARFIAHGRVNIIYEGRRGIRSIGFAEECLRAFERGAMMNMGVTQKPRNNISRVKLALQQRDGSFCFFCLKAITEDTCTIEHLVARGKGGPDHQDNLALAHEKCNKDAANLPLMEKIKIREKHLNE